MTLTAAQCIADMKLAAGTSPEGFVTIDAINSVGVIVSGFSAIHSEIDPMIATGIAMSSGHGVAMTITDRNRTGSPLITHAAMAMISASGV